MPHPIIMSPVLSLLELESGKIFAFVCISKNLCFVPSGSALAIMRSDALSGTYSSFKLLHLKAPASHPESFLRGICFSSHLRRIKIGYVVNAYRTFLHFCQILFTDHQIKRVFRALRICQSCQYQQRFIRQVAFQC